MQINRNNYEAYFLDYRENNLTPEQVAELLVFLEENPDLKDEFESFEDIVLAPDPDISISNKENLKKIEFIPTDNIGQRNYNDFMIADLEGDLTEDESLELKAFISLNPKTKLEYNFYRSTFLKPDKSIQFAGKEKLKKKGIYAIYTRQIYSALAIAASIIILLGIYFRFLSQPESEREIVSTETEKVVPSMSNEQTQQGNLAELEPQKIDLPAENFNPVIHDRDFRFEQITRETVTFRMASLKGNLPQANNSINLLLIENRNSESAVAFNDRNLNDSGKQKSFASRFVAGLAGKVIKTDNLKGKSFLDYTIEGYNLMADKEVSLEKEVDENGKVIAYSLNGESISILRNKNQSKE